MRHRIGFGLAIVLGTIGLAHAQQFDEMQARTACQDDALRLCQATIPDRERTLACLLQSRDSLSGACRTVMAQYFPPEPAGKKSAPQRAKRSGGPVDLSPNAR